MKRIFINSNRVQRVLLKLVPLYIEQGSILSLCNYLNEIPDLSKKIYPNRLSTIMNGKETDSINESTLTAVEDALKDVNPDPELISKSKTEILEKIGTSEGSRIPAAVLRCVKDPPPQISEHVLKQMLTELKEMKIKDLIDKDLELIPILEELAVLSQKYLKILKAV